MKPVSIVLALSLFLVTAYACSSNTPPAPAAEQGNKIIASLKDLSSYYQKKNLPGFMSLVAGSYQERTKLADAVEAVFEKYEAVHFKIQFTRMFIQTGVRGPTRTTFNWDSGWESPGGALLKNSGRATFVFEPDSGRLLSIEGKNPFIPQAIEPQKQ